MRLYKEEILYVYRLRNTVTGIFHTGGRSSANGIYVYLPAVRVIKRDMRNPDNWEIIKYNVTIEGIVD